MRRSSDCVKLILESAEMFSSIQTRTYPRSYVRGAPDMNRRVMRTLDD